MVPGSIPGRPILQIRKEEIMKVVVKGKLAAEYDGQIRLAADYTLQKFYNEPFMREVMGRLYAPRLTLLRTAWNHPYSSWPDHCKVHIPRSGWERI